MTTDLELLDAHGPAPTALSDDALAAARARLAAAVAADSGRRGTSRRLGLLAAAAAAAVGLAVAPAVLGSDDSIALASVDPLMFPVTATWLPDGVGEPVFSKDSALQLVRYGSLADQVSVVAAEGQGFDHWEEVRQVGTTDVAGREGRVLASDPDRLTIAWEQADGDVIGVSGSGRFADRELLDRVADSVRDEAQPVDLFLTVAPEGWAAHAYQSDHHVSYGEQGELSVTLVAGQAPAPDAYGAHAVQDVSVGGRPGWLGQQWDEDGTLVTWVLQTTAPDGRAFALQAPPTLTAEQVVEVAAGVRHR